MQCDDNALTVLCQATDVRLQLNIRHVSEGESSTHKICGFVMLQIVHAKVREIAVGHQKTQALVAPAPQWKG